MPLNLFKHSNSMRSIKFYPLIHAGLTKKRYVKYSAIQKISVKHKLLHDYLIKKVANLFAGKRINR